MRYCEDKHCPANQYGRCTAINCIFEPDDYEPFEEE